MGYNTALVSIFFIIIYGLSSSFKMYITCIRMLLKHSSALSTKSVFHTHIFVLVSDDILASVVKFIACQVV